MASTSTLEEKLAILKMMSDARESYLAKGWGRHVHSRIQLHSYDGSVVIFTFKVEEGDCNPMGTLHGGCFATLADNLTTYSSAIEDRYKRPGVSVSLQVDFMSAPKAGETIYIHCKADKNGKFLAFSSAVFYNERKEILATARHVKFLGNPPEAKL